MIEIAKSLTERWQTEKCLALIKCEERKMGERKIKRFSSSHLPFSHFPFSTLLFLFFCPQFTVIGLRL
jgi:hypothetical protein